MWLTTPTLRTIQGMGGVALLLDAQEQASGNLASFIDTSGNGRDFSSTSTPSVSLTGGPNDAAHVRFESGEYCSRGSSPFAGLTEAELVIVHKFDSASTAAATTNVPWYFCGAASNDLWKYATGPALYCGAGSTTRQTCGNPSQDLTQWHVGNVISTATEFTVNVGAQALYTTGTNAVGFATTCVVGAGLVGGGASMVGDIAEVILYDRKLSTDERNRIKQYLAAQYGAIAGT